MPPIFSLTIADMQADNTVFRFNSAAYLEMLVTVKEGAEMEGFRGVHDVGGVLDEPFEASEHDYQPWEKRVHAIRELLAVKNLLRVDELRRSIESVGETDYQKLTYYEQWIAAICRVMLERGVITDDELGRRIAEVSERDD